MSIPAQAVVNRAEAHIDTFREREPAVGALFQATSRLGDAVRIGLEHADQPSHPSVISVGMSAGPEIDSVLALLARDDQVEEVTATGLVIPGYRNSGASLRRAREGQYILQADHFQKRDKLLSDSFDTTEELENFGFTLRTEHDDDLSEDYVVADAGRVREGHTIAFHEQELPLDSGSITVQPADLVLCNRVLRVLNAPEVETTVRSLVGLTREGGVLALGVAGMSDVGRPMSGTMGQVSQQALRDFVTSYVYLEPLDATVVPDKEATVQFYRKPVTS